MVAVVVVVREREGGRDRVGVRKRTRDYTLASDCQPVSLQYAK